MDQPSRQKRWPLYAIGCAMAMASIWVWSAFIRQDVGADFPLALWSPLDTTQRWINPSVVWHNDRLLVAARRHQLFHTEGGSTWVSDVGIGYLNANFNETRFDISPEGPMSILGDAVLGAPSTCQKENGNWVVGNEDPRLFLLGDSVFLTTVTHVQSRKGCVAREKFVEMVESTSDQERHKAPFVMEDTRMGSSKNWMHLEDELFVTDVATQTVVRLNRNNGKTSHFSSGPLLSWLQSMHGGSNLVAARSSIDGADIWLAVVHTANTYHNHLIELDRAPPYKARRLSKKLPLHTFSSNSTHPGFAFASGLALAPAHDGLVITYGSSDVESRAFFLSYKGMLAIFDGQNIFLG